MYFYGSQIILQHFDVLKDKFFSYQRYKLRGLNRYSSVFISILMIGLLGTSCSRKKDKFLNRSWHNVTTKNNTLYNGRNAYDLGQKDIIQSYRDNFWELLPIERMITIEDVRLPNEVLNQNFDKAEEKAIKAIQKHTMLIDGRERNPKIDEAFLLLGKARYFEQRFIPALEAFNYILYKYPTSDIINHAKVWKAKTNLRLDNNEKAIEDLKRMIEQEYMEPQDYADATSMLSQAFVNLKEIDSALVYISKASIHTTTPEEKGRYNFIEGQLLNMLGKKDSANRSFNRIIDLNRGTPRRYLINAYMAKARNFDYELDNKEEFLELLTDLEENRENRPFLDIIYHQKAQYFKKTDSLEAAVVHYNKSLRTNSEDKYLESLNYQTLGDFNFDDKIYATAGAYYDSTLQRMVVNSKKYRVLKKKRDNLDDVIFHDNIVRKNDSILTVVAMTPEERIAYYKQFTDKLKKEALKAERAEEIAKIKESLPVDQGFNQRRGGAFSRPGSSAIPSGNPNGKALFYFYNATTVSFGQTSFKRKYGNRELKDNWRVSSISNPGVISANEEETEEYSIESDPKYDPQTYIAQLPTDQVVIDSLANQRTFSNYQLGVIYKEKFLEYDLASNKFNKVLDSNPEERLVVPSKYNLFKIYTVQGKDDKATAIKEEILSKHSDSRYAQILRNPNEELKNDKDSPAFRYNKLFKDFQNQKYASVIHDSDELIAKFGGDDNFLPKFELLKAQAIGRFRGFEAYKEALNYVSLNYPQSPEGKEAQKIRDVSIPQIKDKSFIYDSNEEKNYKLVYSFSVLEDVAANTLKEHLDNILKELKYYKMKVSIDVYDKNKQFVVVHARRDKLGAEGLGELLSLGKTEDTRGVDLTKWNRRKKYYKKVNDAFFVISSPDYRVVQIHKNLDAYLENLKETVKEEETE